MDIAFSRTEPNLAGGSVTTESFPTPADLIRDGAQYFKGCYDAAMIQTIRESAADIYRQHDDDLAAGRLEGEAECLQRRSYRRMG